MSSRERHLKIERLGQRGEGVAEDGGHLIFVPYALAGETVHVEVEGTQARLIDVVSASPERIPAICKYYGICGGCAVQSLAAPAYAVWKRGLLVQALQHAKLDLPVGDLVDAHGEGRRRATFHVRYAGGAAHVGFMRARAHDLIDLDACPILAPAMASAITAARAVAKALHASKKPLDLNVTATATGLDLNIKGHGPLDPDQMQRLIMIAEEHDLARIANHGERIIERRPPLLRMGRAEVNPPPSAFLQATEAGEQALAARVAQALEGCQRIADLFAGVGTFSLRLAERARIHAVDVEEPSLQALARAARAELGLQQITTERRDLFRSPLETERLAAYDGVVFDPPRAGAQAQAGNLAASTVSTIVAVSCNVQSFARDAAILCAGGYNVDSITPVDQFRYSPHLEIIGVFRRARTKRRPRRLLG